MHSQEKVVKLDKQRKMSQLERNRGQDALATTEQLSSWTLLALYLFSSLCFLFFLLLPFLPSFLLSSLLPSLSSSLSLLPFFPFFYLSFLSLYLFIFSFSSFFLFFFSPGKQDFRLHPGWPETLYVTQAAKELAQSLKFQYSRHKLLHLIGNCFIYLLFLFMCAWVGSVFWTSAHE